MRRPEMSGAIQGQPETFDSRRTVSDESAVLVAGVLHSAESAEHYTPKRFVFAALKTLGSIDLDPASSEEANQVVGATRIFTREDDGLSVPWGTVEEPSSVFHNPPGTCGLIICKASKSCSCGLAGKFWRKLSREHAKGRVSAAIWIGFNLEQLRSLQPWNGGPLSHLLCFPDKRIPYRQPGGLVGKSPPHASYIALLSDGSESMRHRFFEAFGRLGVVGKFNRPTKETAKWLNQSRCKSPVQNALTIPNSTS